MSAVNCIAILTPAPGKAARLRELLAKLSEEVHSKEDSTTRYLMTEEVGSDNPSLIMVETYKSKEANAQHAKQPHFRSFFAALEKEGLLGKKPYIVQTVDVAGYDLDRKLIRSKL